MSPLHLCVLHGVAAAGLVLGLLQPAAAQADDRLVTIPTRPGVTLSYWMMNRPAATATLVLLPGGSGNIGYRNGQPQSKNFLVRSRDLFAAQGFSVAVVGRPSDRSDLDTGYRAGAEHMEDLRRVVDELRAKSPQPVWLVGTSRGTVSAAAAAIALGPERLAGVVLTSSITAFKFPGAVPTLALDQVRVPVLVLHHEQDACRACAPHEVPLIIKGLTQAPVKTLLWAQGGGPPEGDPCEPMHWHGFIGIEAETVRRVADWVRNPKP